MSVAPPVTSEHLLMSLDEMRRCRGISFHLRRCRSTSIYILYTHTHLYMHVFYTLIAHLHIHTRHTSISLSVCGDAAVHTYTYIHTYTFIHIYTHVYSIHSNHLYRHTCHKRITCIDTHVTSESVLSKTSIFPKKERRKREISNESARGSSLREVNV